MLIRFPNEHQDHHLKQTSWWQHVRQHPKITMVVVAVLAWMVLAPLFGVDTNTDGPDVSVDVHRREVERCVHQLEQAADAWFGDRPHGDRSSAVAFCESEGS